MVAPAIREAGHRYSAELGWRVFLEVAGTDGIRRSVANCPACAVAEYGHDRELCECLNCHGFYAATADPDRWDEMCDALPGATHIGVRTGVASGIFAVDFDVKHGGLQTLHEWRGTTGWAFPETRTHTTKSGGRHLIYRYPVDETGRATAVIGSHNGVNGRRGVDVKGEGGLIIVPPSPGYTVSVGSTYEIREASSELREWAKTARGSSYRIARAAGLIGERLSRGDGVGQVGMFGPELAALLEHDTYPEGVRDELMNTLTFIFRRYGLTKEQARDAIRPYWKKLDHRDTPDEFRWEWVEYKIRRVWHTVPASENLVAGQRWLAAVTAATRPSGPGVGSQVGAGSSVPVERRGNVTLTSNPRRPR